MSDAALSSFVDARALAQSSCAPDLLLPARDALPRLEDHALAVRAFRLLFHAPLYPGALLPLALSLYAPFPLAPFLLARAAPAPPSFGEALEISSTHICHHACGLRDHAVLALLVAFEVHDLDESFNCHAFRGLREHGALHVSSWCAFAPLESSYEGIVGVATFPFSCWESPADIGRLKTRQYLPLLQHNHSPGRLSRYQHSQTSRRPLPSYQMNHLRHYTHRQPANPDYSQDHPPHRHSLRSHLRMNLHNHQDNLPNGRRTLFISALFLWVVTLLGGLEVGT